MCTDTEFACANGLDCIPYYWECDGDLDCEDYSDEVPFINCSKFEEYI